MTNEHTYRLTFTGRKVGAIGIFYPCFVELTASSKEEAEAKLYRTHDHIQKLRVTLCD